MTNMIDAKSVKELREITGIGILECKKALKESEGNIKKAIEIMRKRGVVNATKKSSRTTTEGTIITATSSDKKNAFIAEISCETDFVSRSESFQEFCKLVAKKGLENPKDFLNELEEDRIAMIAKLGENIQIKRSQFLSSTGYVGTYCHGGRIGVLLSIDSKKESLAKDIAMHIAAANPMAIDSTGISKEILDKEREIYTCQTKGNGKPENITKKIIDGRIKKFLESVCLLEQSFIKDTKKTIQDIIKESSTNVIDFIRFEIHK